MNFENGFIESPVFMTKSRPIAHTSMEVIVTAIADQQKYWIVKYFFSLDMTELI